MTGAKKQKHRGRPFRTGPKRGLFSRIFQQVSMPGIDFRQFFQKNLKKSEIL